MNRRNSTLQITLAVVIAVIAVVYTYRENIGWIAVAYLYGVPCASESAEVCCLVNFVTDNFRFAEKSKSMPDRPPIFARPGGTGLLGQTPHIVIVYTVTRSAEQDKIIGLISEYRIQRHLRHVRIKFYREENWRTWSGEGVSRGGGRGKEECVRTDTV